MSLFSGIAHLFVSIWGWLTGEAKIALPIVQNVINDLKALDATNLPADIINAVTKSAKGTAIEGKIDGVLTNVSTGLATAAGLAAETPQEALGSVVGMINKAANDKPTKTLLLNGLATAVFSGVSDTPLLHAAVVVPAHYSGELQKALSDNAAVVNERAQADTDQQNSETQP